MAQGLRQKSNIVYVYVYKLMIADTASFTSYSPSQMGSVCVHGANLMIAFDDTEEGLRP